MKKLRTALGVFLAIMCGVGAARSEIVTFEFAGSLGSIEDPENVIGDQLVADAPAFVSLRYDTAAADLYPDISWIGSYRAPGWLLFDVGGLKFERTTWVDVYISNPGSDQTLFFASAVGGMSAWATSSDPSDILRLAVSYDEVVPPFSMLSGDGLPSSINFSEAVISSFSVSQLKPDRTIEYMLHLNMTPVPEPATWAVLGLGLAGVCWRARRR